MILARLIQAAQLLPQETALVIGAGTGYSAALLAGLVKKVVALESSAELAQRSRAVLGSLAIGNVTIVEGDLKAGRPADGGFDFILVDGAAEFIPEALTKQLSNRGRLATVMTDEGVARGTMFTRADGGVSRRALFDAEADVLPEFRLPQGFVF